MHQLSAKTRFPVALIFVRLPSGQPRYLARLMRRMDILRTWPDGSSLIDDETDLGM